MNPGQCPPAPTRRDFLAAAATAAGVAGAIAGCTTSIATPAENGEEVSVRVSQPVPERRALAPGDRIRCGVIGVGNRGSALLRAVLERDDVDVLAVADTYDVWRDRALQWCREKQDDVKGYVRFEELIAEGKLDAVVVATPDHIHPAAAMDALNAGLDVYCEKPIALTTEQAAALRDRAMETGAVFQAGTQLRSVPVYRKAREAYQSGAIGKLAMVLVNRHFRANPDRPPWPPEANPSNVHWKEFLRETKSYPIDLRRYFHWRDYVEYSNGYSGDLMAHHLDMCHYITGCGMPARVVSAGGIYVVRDGRTCPDTVNTIVEYPEEFQFSFSATAANDHYGLVERYIGSEGIIEIADMTRMTVYREDFEEKERSDGIPDAPHVANFFECVRSREQTVAPAEAGFAAASVAHMAVLSQREGSAVRWVNGQIAV